MFNLYDGKPFTSYWYYKDAYNGPCHHCETEQAHYLLRYRIYLGIRFPIFSTSTNYYIVCSNCSTHGRRDSEGTVAPILSKVQSSQPIKYTKYSQLDFEDYIEDEMMVFGTDAELSKNIQLHVRDMKRNGLNISTGGHHENNKGRSI